MLEIRDSVAVITGGGGGIGLEVAKYWVRNGGKVVISDVASNLLEQAAEELKALQGEVLTVVCNVTREEDCSRLADAAIEKFGKINHNCKGLICLVSSTGSLGTAGQINYSSSKAAMSVMPKVITAEFFRRGIADRIRCVAIAPGYVGTAMVKGMDQKALEKIVQDVPIGRLIEPKEVASLVGELYRNEAMAGDVFFIHGGLRLGSRG